MNRRQAVASFLGIAVGGALFEALEPWLSEPTRLVDRHRPQGIGYDEVGQIENVARSFREWDNQFGGGLKRLAVVGQLAEIADELDDRSHPEPLRRRLFGVLAQLAETAATMSWDSGQGPLAQRYYVMALRAAKEAHDRAFGANILAGMARQLLYLNRTGDALELTRFALDASAGYTPDAVRAMLYTREAWAYANQGRVSAFRRAVAKAEDTLVDARRDNDPHWIVYFDDAELAGVIGGRLLDLAHAGHVPAADAAERIERAIALRPANSLRSTALDRIGVAEARLIQREHNEAARLGQLAIDVAAKTRSDRVRTKLAEFDHHASAFQGVRDLDAMRARARELLLRGSPAITDRPSGVNHA
jgi:hypothetical protein